MIITCSRRIQFCAGHRVYGHETKCKNPHGHNYIATIDARAIQLDAVGRVVDFSVLKSTLGTWIDQNWDHGFIWFKDDHEMKFLYDEYEGQKGLFSKYKNYSLGVNPTAENMAAYLLRGVAPIVLKGTGVTVVKVRLEETENCYAEATLQ